MSSGSSGSIASINGRTFGRAARQRRIHRAGLDQRHPHARRADFLAHRVAEADHAKLAGDVRRLADVGIATRRRGHDKQMCPSAGAACAAARSAPRTSPPASSFRSAASTPADRLRPPAPGPPRPRWPAGSRVDRSGRPRHRSARAPLRDRARPSRLSRPCHPHPRPRAPSAAARALGNDASTSRAPSRANSTAHAAPMPLPPPVITPAGPLTTPPPSAPPSVRRSSSSWHWYWPARSRA